MKQAPTTWLSPDLAVGPERKGARGWLLLGPRPSDGTARPTIAWGRLDRRGLHIERGVLGPVERSLLEEVRP